MWDGRPLKSIWTPPPPSLLVPFDGEALLAVVVVPSGLLTPKGKIEIQCRKASAQVLGQEKNCAARGGGGAELLEGCPRKGP